MNDNMIVIVIIRSKKNVRYEDVIFMFIIDVTLVRLQKSCVCKEPTKWSCDWNVPCERSTLIESLEDLGDISTSHSLTL